ncbi:MAG: hypothetical protein KC736_02505 [Candidatus Moranbacteria bacterium]|nr:hypothetical protein [Candidatus Moranbacteria bacterium]
MTADDVLTPPSFEEFCGKFQFRPEHSGEIGIEQESLVLQNGLVTPQAKHVLDHLYSNGCCSAYFGPELSACQIEDRVGPVSLADLNNHLSYNEMVLSHCVANLGLSLQRDGVGPKSMPLDVSSGARYQSIAKTLSPEQLSVACRLIGTHVHVGMPNIHSAVCAYNMAVSCFDDLVFLSGEKNLERLQLYGLMGPNTRPATFSTLHDFYFHACCHGHAHDPRKNYALIRISPHGTVEFRVFGATSNVLLVEKWARSCLSLCQPFVTSSASV